jgi:hypothetical protein
MAEVDALIKDLVDFRKRSAAKQALIAKGEEAVEPLIRALESGYASVRWSAVSILGHIRDRKAVPYLIEALQDGNVRSAAEEALRQVTGEDFGDDYDAWKRWQEMGGEPSETSPAGTEAAVPGEAELVEMAIAGTNCGWTGGDGVYVMHVPLKDRHQAVTVKFGVTDSDGAKLVVIYTRCGPADARHYEWALRQNLKMSAGALGVTEFDGKSEFVIVDVIGRADATPRLLINAVRRVAKRGDQLEEALTKSDEF